MLHSKNQQAILLTIKSPTLELIATFCKLMLHLKQLKKNTSTNFMERVSSNWNLNQIQFADLEDVTNTPTQRSQEDIQLITQFQILDLITILLEHYRALMQLNKCTITNLKWEPHIPELDGTILLKIHFTISIQNQIVILLIQSTALELQRIDLDTSFNFMNNDILDHHLSIR